MGFQEILIDMLQHKIQQSFYKEEEFQFEAPLNFYFYRLLGTENSSLLYIIVETITYNYLTKYFGGML